MLVFIKSLRICKIHLKHTTTVMNKLALCVTVHALLITNKTSSRASFITELGEVRRRNCGEREDEIDGGSAVGDQARERISRLKSGRCVSWSFGALKLLSSSLNTCRFATSGSTRAEGTERLVG